MSDGGKYNQRYMHVTTRLIWLESTHSAIFFPWNRLRHCSVRVIAWIPSCVSFGSVLLVWYFFKICQMVICPVRRTYNHVSIFLFSSTKKPLNYQVEQYLRLLNSHICLEFLSSPRNFNFFREYVRWWQIQSAVHVTTRLILLESTHSAIFFPCHRLRHDSLGVIAWIPSSISFGSVLLVWYFSKYVRWLYVPS